jgi:hypothetical protein
MEAEAGATVLYVETISTQEKLSNWPTGLMLRRIVSMREACQGKHTFNGPKKLALLRMLHHAQEQGRAIVVVLPVSPTYAKEFLTPEVEQEFENVLVGLQETIPQIHFIRLDQVHRLNSDDLFHDLVHMNSYGQQIATEAFLARFKEISTLP